ncbi:MAG: helix-turn-helix domain-containing protein [Nitrospirales bacterium]
MNHSASVRPTFLDLKTLAAYSSCSVRWLRDRLTDRTRPLPHYRVEGKILVKVEEFEQWMAQYRQDRSTDELDDVVAGVLTQMNFSPACAMDRRP